MDEQATGASGTRLKVATRPAAVGATWLDLFHPGTPSRLSLEARVRVVADVTGALVQIHDNTGVPRQHRRHGRVTPRHLLVGVDGSASLFNTKEPFSKLLPPQPDLGYLAPELLTQSGPANQQSDVFSLGVLLWEALDNGRLFPHRRAAAISRLIARRSLPAPRIEEEWALPLGEVAIKALAYDPAERYADATAFWLALREHLPPPDNARAALAQLAQRALKLEMTAEIRDAPPYLVRSSFLIGQSLPPSSGSLPDAFVPGENSARYSMRPELSSRAPGSASLRPSLTDSLRPAPEAPASSSTSSALGAARQASQPPLASRPASAPQRPLSMGPSSVAPRAEPTNERAPSSAPASSHPPISTLHVNLPRDLVDTSLPFYVSSQPAARAFPWGALSFAALIFFGVGAAVAFGAVTALRTVPRVAPEASLQRAAPARPAPAPVEAQNIQAAQPSLVAAAPPAASANPVTPPAAEATAAPAHVPETPAAAPTKEAVAVPASATRDEVEHQHRAPRHVAKPAKPKRPAPRPAPAAAAAPAPATTPAPAPPVDAAQPPDEGLPFVEQPY